MPIGRANFDGPLSLGYRQKRPRAAIRFKSCATGQPVDDPSRLLSVVRFGMGRCALVIELVAQTALEHLVKTGRCGFDSRPETSKSKTSLSYAALRKRAVRLHYGDETLPTSGWRALEDSLGFGHRRFVRRFRF